MRFPSDTLQMHAGCVCVLQADANVLATQEHSKQPKKHIINHTEIEFGRNCILRNAKGNETYYTKAFYALFSMHISCSHASNARRALRFFVVEWFLPRRCFVPLYCPFATKMQGVLKLNWVGGGSAYSSICMKGKNNIKLTKMTVDSFTFMELEKKYRFNNSKQNTHFCAKRKDAPE